MIYINCTSGHILYINRFYVASSYICSHSIFTVSNVKKYKSQGKNTYLYLCKIFNSQKKNNAIVRKPRCDVQSILN